MWNLGHDMVCNKWGCIHECGGYRRVWRRPSSYPSLVCWVPPEPDLSSVLACGQEVSPHTARTCIHEASLGMRWPRCCMMQCKQRTKVRAVGCGIGSLLMRRCVQSEYANIGVDRVAEHRTQSCSKTMPPAPPAPAPQQHHACCSGGWLRTLCRPRHGAGYGPPVLIPELRGVRDLFPVGTAVCTKFIGHRATVKRTAHRT